VRNEVFLDSNFAIAVAMPSDQLHAKAAPLARQLLTDDKVHVVTTHAVIFEIGNALSKLRFRPAAVDLFMKLSADPLVETVSLTDELYAATLQLFQERFDKEWGLTDCLSFVIMRQLGLTDALTSDQHFEQAGYRALLLG
jgi:uncharacterized protein